MHSEIRQRRFETMTDLRPPVPAVTDEAIAKAIAERLVEVVNLDDFYWDPRERPEIVEAVTSQIMATGKPGDALLDLWKKQPPVTDSGVRPIHPYGHSGMLAHAIHAAPIIQDEVMVEATRKYHERYGMPGGTT